MVEEAGDVSVTHCVDAEEISYWIGRSCLLLFIIMVVSEEIQIEEICDALTILELEM
jgi:hypothetical protein